MKTFEERYTAWVDGRLTSQELTDFEQELVDPVEARADKEVAHKLRDLLRQHGQAPALTNGEFFNHQLRHRMKAAPPETSHRAPSRKWRWSLPHLALAGAACLLIAGALFKMLIPTGDFVENEPQYFAKIIAANAADPTIFATTFYAPEEKVTVIWLDGLDYLPASYTLQ